MNNHIVLVGKIVFDLLSDCEIDGCFYYKCFVECIRTSGYADIIPVIVPRNKAYRVKAGDTVYISGEYRSFNFGDNHLHLMIYAEHIEITEEKHSNNLVIDGYICKQPILRTTPKQRKISDLLIAVNRGNGKTDYIPVIAWGNNAIACYELPIGSHIKIKGRVQSREYLKNGETKVAYEVSCNTVELVK